MLAGSLGAGSGALISTEHGLFRDLFEDPRTVGRLCTIARTRTTVHGAALLWDSRVLQGDSGSTAICDMAQGWLAAALAAEGAAAGGGALRTVHLAGALGTVRVRAGVGAALAV